MSENEAINELQANIDLPFGFTVSDEASRVAIQALEEIQAYRAIGTVEDFKDLKEDNRFLEFLYDRISPNEMEQYLSMYKATDIKTNGL